MAPRTTLTFLGAAGTVTGSRFLVTVGDRRVLVDAGLFQGEKALRRRNWEDFPVEPAGISDVVLTHAHLDHVGYLPALSRDGFDGPVWCTPGTRAIAGIVLRDAASLQEQDAADANRGGWSKHHPARPLYTSEDVEALLGQFVELEYDADFELTGSERPGFAALPDETVTIRLTRAGHILGSASVNLWTPSASVLFSGDLGRHDHPVLRPREVPPGAPFVLVESTYGDREHPEPVNLPHEGFADVIRRTIARGGTVVVPAFAIDRTEIVLKAISDLQRDGRIPDVPVYVDSPMGTAALDLYHLMTDELRPDLLPEEFVRIPGLTTVRGADESRRLSGPGGHPPAVIVSSSGMATGGRVLHHLARLLPDRRNAVVLTGYQASGTRGRQLADGAAEVKIHGRYVPVEAEVYHDREFSVHADRSDLLDWLRSLDPPPEQVFCVHGEADVAGRFTREIYAELGLRAVAPRHGEVVLLDSEGARPAGRRPAAAVGSREPSSARTAQPAGSADVAVERPAAGVAAVAAVAGVAAPRPPDEGGPYRLITGGDDEDFCRRVSEALAAGWVLHGSPALAVRGVDTIAAQAVVWPHDVQALPPSNAEGFAVGSEDILPSADDSPA